MTELLAAFLLFQLAVAGLTLAVLHWWFRTDLPGLLVGRFAKRKLDSPDAFMHWLSVDMFARRGVAGRIFIRMITCPDCLGTHVQTVIGIGVWAVLLRDIHWLPLLLTVHASHFFVLQSFRKAGEEKIAAPARIPAPLATKSVSKQMPPNIWRGLGLNVSDDGTYVTPADPVLAAIHRFFDPAVPCFFPGCEGLRTAYLREKEEMESKENCTNCSLNALRQSYTLKVEQHLGLGVETAVQISPDKVQDAYHKALQAMNPAEPLPEGLTPECEAVVLKIRKEVEPVMSDKKSAETLYKNRLAEVIQCIKPVLVS